MKQSNSIEQYDDMFPNFRELLNNKDITAYRKHSGERFRLHEWAEDKAGYEFLKQFGERLLEGDQGLVSEFSLARLISLKEGIHTVIENTAKSFSMFPPLGKRCEGVDFHDMSQDFEIIC